MSDANPPLVLGLPFEMCSDHSTYRDVWYVLQGAWHGFMTLLLSMNGCIDGYCYLNFVDYNYIRSDECPHAVRHRIARV